MIYSDKNVYATFFAYRKYYFYHDHEEQLLSHELW